MIKCSYCGNNATKLMKNFETKVTLLLCNSHYYNLLLSRLTIDAYDIKIRGENEEKQGKLGKYIKI